MGPSTKDKGKVSTSHSRIKAKSVGLIMIEHGIRQRLGNTHPCPQPRRTTMLGTPHHTRLLTH
jgi:hypothetical protein